MVLAAAAAAVLALPASASATGFWSDPSGADLVANAAPPVDETVRSGRASRHAACASRRNAARGRRRCFRLRVPLGSRGFETGRHVAPAAIELPSEPFRREGLVR